MDDDEPVGGWQVAQVQPLKKPHEEDQIEPARTRLGSNSMGDDEDVGNAWTNGWLRHYCAGGPTPGKMAEWFRYCKMAAGAR